MKKIKILIVDDHKIIRDGIKAMLEDNKNYVIAGEAENGEQAIATCGKGKIDIVLMDINLPVMDGIEVTKKIKDKYPDIKVLALTMMQEEQHIRRMIQAGASGYILKKSGKEALEEAIRTLQNDKYYFSDEATQTVMMDMVNGKAKSSIRDDAELTERELEVLDLVCQELTNQEIADQLYISVRTVDAHRRNLLQKTGARNTAGLVRYAMENKLI